MKLYTRTGDDGSTGLFGGTRVPKNGARIEAYGTVDELNATVGVAITSLPEGTAGVAHLRTMLIDLQSLLFDLGADLATPLDSPHADKVRRLNDDDIRQLETWIDEIDAANPAMTSFILPGGTPAAAHLHVARTICRRAERRVLSCGEEAPLGTAPLTWLNRLSDLLFALARRVNHELGVADTPWTSPPL